MKLEWINDAISLIKWNPNTRKKIRKHDTHKDKNSKQPELFPWLLLEDIENSD